MAGLAPRAATLQQGLLSSLRRADPTAQPRPLARAWPRLSGRGRVPASPGGAGIAAWAAQRPTAVALDRLASAAVDQQRRREQGTFLHRELRVRFARQVLELRALPSWLAGLKAVEEVRELYSNAVLRLDSCVSPE